MGFLNQIQADAPPPPPEEGVRRPPERRLRVTLDVGRGVQLAVVLVALVVAIVVLYSTDNDGPARILVDIFIAVLSAGLGINAGERAAARDAAAALGE